MENFVAKTVLDLDQIHTLKVANSPKLLLGTTPDSTGSSGSGGNIKMGLTLSGKLSGMTANDSRRPTLVCGAATQPISAQQTALPAPQEFSLCKEDSMDSIASVMSVKDMVVSLCSASPQTPSIVQQSLPSDPTSESIDRAVLDVLKPLLATKSIQLPERLNYGDGNLSQAPFPLHQGTSRLGGGWRQGNGGGHSAGLLNWLSNKAEANGQAKVVVANISAPPAQSRTLMKAMKPRNGIKRNKALDRKTSSAESSSPTKLALEIETATRERVNSEKARTAPTAPKPQAKPQLRPQAESGTAPVAPRMRAAAERPPVAKSQPGQRPGEGLTIPRRQCDQVLRLQAMIAGPTPCGRRLYNDMPPLLPAGSGGKMALLSPGSKAPGAEKEGSYEYVAETPRHSGNSRAPAMERPKVALAPEEKDGEDCSLLSDDGSETESIALDKELPSDEVEVAEDELYEASTTGAESLAPSADEADIPLSDEVEVAEDEVYEASKTGAESLAPSADEADIPLSDEVEVAEDEVYDASTTGAESLAPSADEADIPLSAQHSLSDVRDADIINDSHDAQPPVSQVEALPVMSTVSLDAAAGQLLEPPQGIPSPPRPYLRLRNPQTTTMRKSTSRSMSVNWSVNTLSGGTQQAQLESSAYEDLVINGSPTASKSGDTSDSPQGSNFFRPEDIRQEAPTMAHGYGRKFKQSSLVDDPEEPFLVTPWNSDPRGDELLSSQDGVSNGIPASKSMGNLKSDAGPLGFFLPAINAEDALRRLRHSQSIPRASYGAEHATHHRLDHRRVKQQRSFSSCSPYQPGSGCADLKLPPIHLRHRRSSLGSAIESPRLG